MFRDQTAERNRKIGALAIGATAGLALGWILGRTGAGAWWVERDLDRMERRLREALEADRLLGRREVEVGVLAAGIVELTGTVRDEDEADRAVRVAGRVPGVRTVLNRLDIQILDDHLAETRRRIEEDGAAPRERHWYGLRVGTGPRRQSERTDPDRPSDKVPIVSRELGADRAVEQTSEVLDKLAPGVEGHTTVPAAPSDRGTAQDAPHRRLGNVGPEPLQALNPASGIHENVNKGTKVSLEESGLEEELRKRGVEDRS